MGETHRSVLREHGTLGSIDLSKNNNKQTTEEERKVKSLLVHARAAEVMGKISNSSRTILWVIVFGFIFIFYILGVLSSDDGQTHQPNTGRPPIRVLNDFYYPGEEGVNYPNCELRKGYTFAGRNETYMADYNMLAALGK